MTARTPLRVLLSVRGLETKHDPTRNPYIDLLVQSLPSDVEVVQFGWREALVGRFDVFHSHWPEALVRSRSRRVRALEHVLFALFVCRLRLARKGVVHTAHNDRPHEAAGRVEAALLRFYQASVTLVVDINGVRTTRSSTPRVLIPHGDYAPWLASHPRARAERGRLCTFGMIRPYKNVPGLLRAFHDLADPSATLSVLGGVADPALRDEIEQLGARDDRVELHLRFATDRELVDQITRSELVVLPYRHMKNTGAGIYALTLGRPLLVPRTDETLAMREEFGARWVHVFDGDLTAETLAGAVQHVRAATGGAPDLSGRDWSRHGADYRRAYLASRPVRRSRPVTAPRA